MKTLPKGPFLGINNRLPAYALHKEKVGDFLRGAVNVDVDNAGSLRRRRAATLVQALVAPHSLHMTSDTTGYMVRGSSIYAITLPAYSETLFKVLTSNNPVSWLELAGHLYYSNGVDSGRISSGVWYPWALPTPTAPSVSSIAGGLGNGAYQVVVSYCNSATGEEGGVSPATRHSLATIGGLRVTLPGATPGATHINVYVSTVNGSVPLLAATVTAGTPTVDLAVPATGREANERFEAPLPAGTQLFEFNGCLCSVNGSDVFEGIPYRHGYYLKTEGRIPFPAAVSNAVPAENGVYVVADKTYWLQGAVMTKAEIVKDVLPYGGVPGTAFVMDKDAHQVGWFSRDGIVLADTMGQVKALMADNVALTAPASGVSALFSDGGYNRVVSCGWCLNLDTMAATRYTGYDFDSISRGYATKPDGIYALAGAGKVAWTIDLGKDNFGTEAIKTMPAAYLGYASDEPISLRVQTTEHDYTYSARSCSSDLQIHRVDPGKGLSANWFDLSLVGEYDFTLATVSFAPVASNRRI